MDAVAIPRLPERECTSHHAVRYRDCRRGNATACRRVARSRPGRYTEIAGEGMPLRSSRRRLAGSLTGPEPRRALGWPVGIRRDCRRGNASDIPNARSQRRDCRRGNATFRYTRQGPYDLKRTGYTGSPWCASGQPAPSGREDEHDEAAYGCPNQRRRYLPRCQGRCTPPFPTQTTP